MEVDSQNVISTCVDFILCLQNWTGIVFAIVLLSDSCGLRLLSKARWMRLECRARGRALGSPVKLEWELLLQVKYRATDHLSWGTSTSVAPAAPTWSPPLRPQALNQVMCKTLWRLLTFAVGTGCGRKHLQGSASLCEFVRLLSTPVFPLRCWFH